MYAKQPMEIIGNQLPMKSPIELKDNSSNNEIPIKSSILTAAVRMQQLTPIFIHAFICPHYIQGQPHVHMLMLITSRRLTFNNSPSSNPHTTHLNLPSWVSLHEVTGPQCQSQNEWLQLVDRTPFWSSQTQPQEVESVSGFAVFQRASSSYTLIQPITPFAAQHSWAGLGFQLILVVDPSG